MTKSLMQEAYEKELRKMSASDKMLEDYSSEYTSQGVTTVIVPAPTANNVKYFTRISLADVGGAKQGVWHVVWDECSDYLATQPREPISEPTCECGSGSNAIGQGHYHWCRRYLAGG